MDGPPWRLLAALLCLVPPAAWGQVPRGGETQVNEFTPSFQYHATVASSANGNFVVVWHDYGAPGQLIKARRYDASGGALGSEFPINTFTTGLQARATAAGDAAGNVVVVWDSPQDGSNTGIYARRIDASGNVIGASEFRVNSFTTGYQVGPRAALAGDGSLMVVWDSNHQDGSVSGVMARRYDAAGLPTTPTDIQVNSFTTSNQSWPSVAGDAAGNFVVAWSGNGPGDLDGVFAQRFDAAGMPLGAEFRVNVHTNDGQSQPVVAARADGSFMVAWVSAGQDGSGGGIVARRYTASGAPEGSEFVVNAFTPGYQQDPEIAVDGGGGFVVTWTSDLEDGSGTGIFGRRYDAAGAPSAAFQVNTYTTHGQAYSAVTAAANGDFVVAWESDTQDGSYLGVFAQRFSPDVIFQDDFESGTLARWSSSMTDGGDLSPSAFAALDFSTVGLQGVVDDATPLFVVDESPENEDVYRARFWFDPNGFDPGEGQLHLRTRIFIAFEEAPTRRLAAVVLRRQSGVYSLMGRARLDDNSQENTGFFPISDGPHAVEIAWRRSSGPAEEDGEFQMWIDGNLVSTRSNLDNSLSAVDFVRLGALSVKSGASGTMYWDEFESRRGSFIGP